MDDTTRLLNAVQTGEPHAAALGLSRATAFRDWAYARAWIATGLGGPDGSGKS